MPFFIMAFTKRTHDCGELRSKHVRKSVTLNGWVHSRRDHGGVIFIDLRDRYGLAQVVFDPSHDKKLHSKAEQLRREYVLSVTGKIRPRKEGMVNPKMPTGEIEMLADTLEILNPAETPPIEIMEEKAHASEDIRLKYRYLDLRRAGMRDNMILRHKIVKAIRDYLDSEGFLEIETPMLVRSTPEGARDFLVPSRLYPGKGYALPQSPQLYKQLLMVSGLDKYFQVVKCFRDEDLRADRQHVFTQVDLEMSFVTEEDVQRVTEGFLKAAFAAIGKKIKTPFPHLDYQEAIDRFGSDKPDLRFGLEITDIADIAKSSGYKIFETITAGGGWVRGLNVKGKADFSRKDIDGLSDFAMKQGAKGLSWIKVTKTGMESSIVKYFKPEALKKIAKKMDAKPGDLLLFVAGTPKIVATSLGNLRLHLGEKLGMIPKEELNFVWIVNWPLVEWDEDDERWGAVHHPFTSPVEADVKLLEKEPGKARAMGYDVVLNGVELGGGSIRIADAELQKRVFKLLGLSDKEAVKRFGFLLDAFRYGTPPHGGIAIGLDRLVMLMVGAGSIRETIAFPVNKAMVCPMDGAPSDIDEKTWKEVHLKPTVVKTEKKGEKKTPK